MFVLCFVFCLYIVFSRIGVYFLNFAYDYYSIYSSAFKETFDLSSLLINIGTVFLLIGIVMVFILGFIVFRLKLQTKTS